jgi:hypothetical protein
LPFLMVSTTCVLGLLVAVLTVVKRPVEAFRPILLVLMHLTSFPGLLPGPQSGNRARDRRW